VTGEELLQKQRPRLRSMQVTRMFDSTPFAEVGKTQGVPEAGVVEKRLLSFSNGLGFSWAMHASMGDANEATGTRTWKFNQLAFPFRNQLPGHIATGSDDRTVRLWRGSDGDAL